MNYKRILFVAIILSTLGGYPAFGQSSAMTFFITDILYGVIDPRVRLTEKTL